MADHIEQRIKQQMEILKSCRSLKELLTSVQPISHLAVFQEITTIERNALRATDIDQLWTVEEELDELMKRLRGEGILNTERRKKFFGGPE